MDTIPEHTNKIYRICITGGPCAGKTTCMSFLREKLSPQFMVYSLPEVASFTFGGGVTIIPTEFTDEDHVVFTGGIMEMQYHLENYFTKIAAIQKKDVVILTDRGIMDNTAYCTSETEQKVYEQYGWSKSSIRDNRYDMVVHLVTAANGAEEFYTLGNNEARSESPEVARGLDEKTMNVWNGHPNLVVINNDGENFQDKIQKAYQAICRTVGVDTVPRHDRKFLLSQPLTLEAVPADLKAEEFEETYTFLNNNEEDHVTWLKKRTSQKAGGPPYLVYIDRKISENVSERIELRRKVSPNLYGEQLKMRDLSRNDLVKNVIQFIYENQNFVVESYKTNSGEQVTVARVAVESSEKEIKFPEFMTAGDEVTTNPKFFSHNLADPNFA